MYNLRFEPPMDPPEPEVAFYCDECGCEIYVGETYYRIDGKNYCEYCIKSSQETAEKDYDDDGPDPDRIYDAWRDRQIEKDWKDWED